MTSIESPYYINERTRLRCCFATLQRRTRGFESDLPEAKYSKRTVPRRYNLSKWQFIGLYQTQYWALQMHTYNETIFKWNEFYQWNTQYVLKANLNYNRLFAVHGYKSSKVASFVQLLEVNCTWKWLCFDGALMSLSFSAVDARLLHLR